jgi:hypothetical protein
MASTSPFTMEERLDVSVRVHEKGRSGETANFALRLNEAAPAEANLRRFGEKEGY